MNFEFTFCENFEIEQSIYHFLHVIHIQPVYQSTLHVKVSYVSCWFVWRVRPEHVCIGQIKNLNLRFVTRGRKNLEKIIGTFSYFDNEKYLPLIGKILGYEYDSYCTTQAVSWKLLGRYSGFSCGKNFHKAVLVVPRKSDFRRMYGKNFHKTV